MLTNTQT